MGRVTEPPPPEAPDPSAGAVIEPAHAAPTEDAAPVVGDASPAGVGPRAHPGPQPIDGAAAPVGEDPEPPARTHGRLKTWVIVVIGLAVLAGAAFASTYTPLFAVDRVRVEGSAHLTEEQVRRIAGVEPGANVFRLDEGKAERRLERNPWVADAQVTTQLPSGVTILVREREPAAVAVTGSAGERSIVAGDGTILEPSRGPAILPLIRAADGAAVPDEAQRALGATVAASVPHSILGEVESVLVGGDGSVDLILSGGVPVSYGDGTALDAKGQALRAVLLYADREGVRLASVNVRTPGAPTARLGGGVVVAPQG
jgi:cell division protein FtsQ